jgi:hypothetical protein
MSLNSKVAFAAASVLLVMLVCAYNGNGFFSVNSGYGQPVSNSLSTPELESVDEQSETDSNLNSTTNSVNPTDFLKYDDEDLGFSIAYPSDWDVNTKDLTHNMVVVFKPPEEGATVEIKFFPRDSGKTLTKFSNELKNDDNYKISQFYRNSTTKLGGLPAVRTLGINFNTVSTFEDALGYQSSTDKLLMIWTLDKEKDGFFGVLYRSDKSTFPTYLQSAEQMINSFQINKGIKVISED